MRRLRGRPALRSGVLAAVVVLATTATGQAGPLDPPRDLVVSGSGTKMLKFTLRSEISFWRDDVKVSLGDGATYGGAVIIAPNNWFVFAGAYRISALENLALPEPSPVRAGRARSMGGPGGLRATLGPGTYRVYLFGNGTTEYRVPLITGTALTLRPSQPARSSLHTEQLLLPPDVDPDRDRAVLTRWFSRPNTAVTKLHGMMAGPGLTTAATVRVCFNAKPACNTHGVTLGPMDMMLTGSATAGTGISPEYQLSSKGRYQAVAEFFSDRSVATTITLAVMQVEY